MPTKKSSITHWEYLQRAVFSHNSDECLIWPFRKCQGYGECLINKVVYRVPRLAFKLFHGKFPDNFACHTCDVPSCFNPRHLFDGTCKENYDDMVKKGRKKSCCRAKIQEDAVIALRTEYARGGITRKELGKKYNISVWTVKHIVERTSWKHA